MRRTGVRRNEHGPQPNDGLRQSSTRKMPTTGLEPVRRFRHWSLKPACLPIPARGRPSVRNRCVIRASTRPHDRTCSFTTCSGRDSNPHGVNPHRNLNPARLPIPPPERPDPSRDGAEGNRTPDLLNAIQALSQLSYGPNPSPIPDHFKKLYGADGTRTRGLRCDRPAL